MTNSDVFLDLFRRVNDDGPSDPTGLVPGTTLPTYRILSTMLIPFFGGSASLLTTLYGQFNCKAGDPCSMEMNFLNTVLLGNAQLLSTNGIDPLVGATLASESGYDYTQSFAAQTVPEPQSGLLIAIGAVLIAWRRLSRRG